MLRLMICRNKSDAFDIGWQNEKTAYEIDVTLCAAVAHANVTQA